MGNRRRTKHYASAHNSVGTYDSAVRVVINDGAAPVRRLFPRFRLARLVSADRPDGSGPDRALFDTARPLEISHAAEGKQARKRESTPC